MFKFLKNIISPKKKEKKEETLLPIEKEFFDNEEREDDEYLTPLVINLLELLHYNDKDKESEIVKEKIVLDENIQKFYDQLHDIYNYGNLYKVDTIEAITQIIGIYKDLLISGKGPDSEEILRIIEIFPKINKALENIYYDTTGAAVYMNEKDIKLFRDELIAAD